MSSKIKASACCLLAALFVSGVPASCSETVTPVRSAEKLDPEAETEVDPELKQIRDLYKQGREQYAAKHFDVAEQTFHKLIEVQQRGAYKPYDALVWLGRIQLHKNNIPEAFRLWRRSLKMREALFGTQEKLVTGHRRALIEYYVSENRYNEAIAIYRHSVSVARSSDPLGQDLMQSLNDLATFYIRLKKDRLAMPLLQEELMLRETQLGKHESQTARCRSLLAHVYAQMKRQQDAINLYDSIIAGPITDDQANALSQKAYFLIENNQLQQAVESYKKAVTIRLSLLGTPKENRKCLMGNLKSLARICEKLGDLESAEAFSKKLIDVAYVTKNFTAELDATRQYATFLWRHKRHREADPLMQREMVLDPIEKSSFMRARRAEFLLATKRADEAAKLMSVKMDIKDGDRLWFQFCTMEKIAEYLVKQGRTAEAEQQFMSMIALLRDDYAYNADVRVVERIAAFYIARGQAERAVELLKPIYERNGGLAFGHKMAEIYLAAGNSSEARKVVQKGLKVLHDENSYNPTPLEQLEYRIHLPYEGGISGSQCESITLDREGGVYHENVQFGGDYMVEGSRERSENEVVELPVRWQRPQLERGFLFDRSNLVWDLSFGGKEYRLSTSGAEALLKLQQAHIFKAEGESQEALKLYPKIITALEKEDDCASLKANVIREFEHLQRFPYLTIKPAG